MLSGIQARNSAFYDSVWRHARLRAPCWHSTWSVVEDITRGRRALLEIGPGVRPRFPLERSCFADVSRVAVRKLRASGGRAALASAQALPFPDATFDAACALDVVEHAMDPALAMLEIARVLRPQGVLLLSVPLHARRWTRFDGIVGHSLRFEPEDLRGVLREAGLRIDASSPFGILPRSRRLVAVGAWALEHFRGAAAWFEDRVVQPIVRSAERPHRWRQGLPPRMDSDGVLLLCSRT